MAHPYKSQARASQQAKVKGYVVGGPAGHNEIKEWDILTYDPRTGHDKLPSYVYGDKMVPSADPEMVKDPDKGGPDSPLRDIDRGGEWGPDPEYQDNPRFERDAKHGGRIRRGKK